MRGRVFALRADRHPGRADAGHRRCPACWSASAAPACSRSAASASPSPPPGSLLLAAGVVGVLAGIGAFRQMDDKRGVPVLADLWGSLRGRPLEPARAGRAPRGRVRGLRGRRGRRQVHPGRPARRARCVGQGRDVVVTREPGATEVGARIRSLVLDQQRAGGARRGARPAGRGAALRRRPGPPRRHRRPPGAGPRRGGDQRPVRRLVPGLPGRRPDAAGRRGLLAVRLGHRRPQARPGGAARHRPGDRAWPGSPRAAPRRPAGGRVARRSTSGSGTRSSTSPPRPAALPGARRVAGRPTEIAGRWSGRVAALLGRAGPASCTRGRRTARTRSVQPESSDAELVDDGADQADAGRLADPGRSGRGRSTRSCATWTAGCSGRAGLRRRWSARTRPSTTLVAAAAAAAAAAARRDGEPGRRR